MQNRFPSFVKLPQHKRFNFKTRYYDANKEALDERVARIKREMAAEESGEAVYSKEALKSKIEQEWHRGGRRGHNTRSNMRIAFIAALLVLFFYYYLYL
jgi:3-phenylpropionate/cinnamic acid dioxygenase small subunit